MDKTNTKYRNFYRGSSHAKKLRRSDRAITVNDNRVILYYVVLCTAKRNREYHTNGDASTDDDGFFFFYTILNNANKRTNYNRSTHDFVRIIRDNIICMIIIYRYYFVFETRTQSSNRNNNNEKKNTKKKLKINIRLPRLKRKPVNLERSPYGLCDVAVWLLVTAHRYVVGRSDSSVGGTGGLTSGRPWTALAANTVTLSVGRYYFRSTCANSYMTL